MKVIFLDSVITTGGLKKEKKILAKNNGQTMQLQYFQCNLPIQRILFITTMGAKVLNENKNSNN